jgi:NAD(P)-dependent dehydrogenase (short-subunit alcohol dehydrogenase family)
MRYPTFTSRNCSCNRLALRFGTSDGPAIYVAAQEMKKEFPMKLQDTVAIVTGAGSGIGLAITERFLAEGARVVAGDIAEAHLATLQKLPGANAVRADVTVQADLDRLVATAEGLGRLDIMVNNAGIMDRFLPVGEVDDDLWERVLAVNFTAPMRLVRAALPAMLRAWHGVIINIASVGGLAGARAGATYVSSKHGVIGLTRNIAATYGSDGIRCVAIAPGGANTGISIGGVPSERGFAALNRTLPANLPTVDGGWLAH